MRMALLVSVRIMVVRLTNDAAPLQVNDDVRHVVGRGALAGRRRVEALVVAVLVNVVARTVPLLKLRLALVVR